MAKKNNTSDKIQNNFGETSERLQNELKKQPADLDVVMSLLSYNYEGFLQFISENFGVTSERVRREFGDTSETLQTTEILILIIVLFDKTITAEKISKILDVSIVTVKRYFKKLQQKDFITREGSKKTGIWKITISDTL